MERIKTIFEGYRIPNFSNLWSSSSNNDDEVDKNEQTDIFIQLESLLVNFQELCLWVNPTKSIAAVFTVQVLYYYLSATSNTTTNLAAWSLLMGYLYSTWVNRIWPEIRVPLPENEIPDKETFTPIHPHVISGPEIKKIAENFKISLLKWGDYRRENPALFCALGCAFFVVIAYLGSYVTLLGLFYLLTNACLILPAVIFKSLSPEFTEKLLESVRMGFDVEDENNYLPVESKDNMKFLEVPNSDEQSVSEIFKDSLDSTTNSFLNELDSIPAFDEIDDCKKHEDEDFLPTTRKTLAEAIEDDDDYSDDFSLQNSKDAKFLVEEDDDDFEMITDDDLNQLK